MQYHFFLHLISFSCISLLICILRGKPSHVFLPLNLSLHDRVIKAPLNNPQPLWSQPASITTTFTYVCILNIYIIQITQMKV